MADVATPLPTPVARPPVRPLVLLAIVGVVYLATCWTTLADLKEVWATNPQYSHGFLVPVFAGFLLWHRRALIPPRGERGSWRWLPVLAIGCALKLAGAYYVLVWPERVSVVVIAAGLVGVLGGWRGVRWAWPAVAFLLFMVPPPTRFEMLMSGPMQRVATVVSANVLQTLGFFAQPDGTIIVLSEVDLGIVEACSGLRMLIAFVAMSTAIAAVIDRPTWQRVAIVLGAFPVALICNIGRIVVTAVMHETAGKAWADLVFHDLAGWLMMPAGLVLLWLELVFVNRVIVPEFPAESAGRDGGRQTRPSPGTGQIAPQGG